MAHRRSFPRTIEPRSFLLQMSPENTKSPWNPMLTHGPPGGTVGPFCPFNLFWLRNDGKTKTEATSRQWKTSMFQQNCRLYFPRPNATSANATNVTPPVTVTEAEVPKSYSKKIGDEKMVCMDDTLPETNIFAPNI